MQLTYIIIPDIYFYRLLALNKFDRFLQAVEEMAYAVEPLFHDPINGDFYRKAFLYLTEPERMISFHVPWYVSTH
jgi:hypothetical protein